MHLPIHFSMHLTRLLVILAASIAAAGLVIWLLFRGRKKMSDSEMERERRLAVNAVGRMTDGTLLEPVNTKGDSINALLVFYQYSVSGVEYSAAQDLSDLRDSVHPGTYFPGETVTVKYNRQNPSESIVACERWCGLPAERESVARRRDTHVSWQGVK